MLILITWGVTSILKKPLAENRVKSAVAAIDIPKEILYADTIDNGCQRHDTGWLGYTEYCKFTSDKFYKGSDDVVASLKLVDESLLKSGWQRDGSFPGLSDFKEPEEHGDTFTINYTKPNASTTIKATYFSKKVKPFRLSVAHSELLLSLLKSQSLEDNEYIFGVTAITNY